MYRLFLRGLKVSTLGSGTSSRKNKSTHRDPVTLTILDEVTGAVLAEEDLWIEEWRAEGHASVEWTDTSGLVLIGGANGTASISLETITTSGWMQTTWTGTASVVDGVFATSGNFATLNWTVGTVSGVTTATLPVSERDPEFAFLVEADGLGTPTNDVLLQLTSQSIGSAEDYATLGSEGVCCLPDDSCVDALTDEECQNLGGAFGGDVATCAEVTCLLPEGSCCLPSGDCVDTTEATCQTALHGLYQGDGTTCVAASCPVCGDGTMEGAEECDDGNTDPGDGCSETCLIEGACCLQNGNCTDGVPQQDCEELTGSTYAGDAMTCENVTCVMIPTVSEWGLIVMTLLVLTAGTIVVGRLRRRTAA